MAREYAKNWFSMWTDDDFCRQPVIDKLLYNVLLAQPAINYAGVQPINLKRWRKALREGDRMPTELDVKAALIRLQRRAYVFTDDDTGETLVRSLMRNDGIDKQPNVMLSALRSTAAVESPILAAVLLSELQRITLPEVSSEKLRQNLKQLSAAAVTHLETLTEGLPEPLTEPFAEDFPEGLPKPLTRPAEIEPFGEPFPEGLPKPPVVVEVGVIPPPADTSVGEAREPDAENGRAAATTDPNGPPRICSRHPHGTDKPCRECQAIRETVEAELRQRQTIKSTLLAAFWADVRACPDCDDSGYAESEAGRLRRCPQHDWAAIRDA